MNEFASSASAVAPAAVPLLQVEKLAKVFQTCHGPVTVLQDLDLSLNAGERLAIIGASGSGKTTLMQILGTLDRPTSGRCRFAGRDLFAATAAELNRFRNAELGFVFQFHQLLPEFTALENVLLPLLIARQNRHAALPQAEALLQRVGLGHRLHHKPGQLSGGEQQRVAIARALVRRPRLLIADEPTGNLDGDTALEIYQLLDDLHRNSALTLVVVTHNEALAARMDRICRLEQGRLVTLA
ncbi:ABC transporter ATP-binding protein [Desulfuromonas thiophila]|uniref:Lipoprotein-releasing system ATP-binding protein n=1 Tax=Desulfuromonas thiophila TaxID=57664 RepID=A0A1G7BRQ2_9BACT|nr:ABC transporter ATP-binding protein [Desulfuromonas thiophila]SDE29632.1 lipoprotein-releasing system ATP-binding protein [Desulfuromonas thiophila]